MSRDKSAKAKIVPDTKKQPKSSESASYISFHPSWRLGRIQMQHPYGCHELTSEEWNRLWNHLRELEKKTWDEILVKGKKLNHNIPVGDLSKPAQDRLKEIFKPLDFDG